MGYNPALFDAVSEAFTAGTIYPNNSVLNTVTLSENELKSIKKLLDKAVWTYKDEMMSYPDHMNAYTLELTDEKNRNYKFCVFENLIVDSNAEYSKKPNIELNSAELYGYVAEVYKSHMASFVQSGYETSTDIRLKYPNTATTDSNGEPAVKSAAEYIVSDLKFNSPTEDFELLGFDVSERFFTISFINNSMQTINYTEDFTVDKLADGKWEPVEQINKHQIYETIFVEPNRTANSQLPANVFFINFESGTYRINMVMYTDGKPYAVSVEFTAKAYMIMEYNTHKIEGTPVKIEVRPKDSDNFHHTAFTQEEMQKIAEIYTTSDFSSFVPDGRLLNPKPVRVTIVDNKGYKYEFVLYNHGVIEIGGRSYQLSDGVSLYEMLTSKIIHLL